MLRRVGHTLGGACHRAFTRQRIAGLHWELGIIKCFGVRSRRQNRIQDALSSGCVIDQSSQLVSGRMEREHQGADADPCKWRSSVAVCIIVSLGNVPWLAITRFDLDSIRHI